MTQTIRAIALRTTRYSDRASILTAWSAERGIVSLSMSASAGRESARRRALTQPLSLFECVGDFHKGGEIVHVRDLRQYQSLATLATNALKSSVSIFLAEVLSRVLRGGGDEGLWNFLTTSLETFDKLRGKAVANFHIYFLCRLAYALGIGPDVDDWREGRVFDFAEARYIDKAVVDDKHDLTGRDARLVRILALADCHRLSLLALNHEIRNKILDHIIYYYMCRQMPISPLRTLDVVRAL